MGKFDSLIGDLGLKPFGQKGWFCSPSIPCPSCGLSGDKVGFLLRDRTAITHCFRCGTVLRIDSYLAKTGHDYLIEETDGITSLETIHINKDIVSNLKDFDYSMPDIKMPVGYRPIKNDPYLDSRNFTKFQYSLFGVGISMVELSMREYLIFTLMDDERIVGWLGRTRHSFKWHEDNNKLFKKGQADLLLRYTNAPGVDFSKYVLGCDELSEGTRMVLVVEGITDKASTDRKLGLYTSRHTRCVCTFGKNITEYQIKRILDKAPNLERFVFLYDLDGIKEVRKCGSTVLRHFRNVEGCVLSGKDPDEMSQIELIEAVDNSMNIHQFVTSAISIPKFN